MKIVDEHAKHRFGKNKAQILLVEELEEIPLKYRRKINKLVHFSQEIAKELKLIKNKRNRNYIASTICIDMCNGAFIIASEFRSPKLLIDLVRNVIKTEFKKVIRGYE